MEGIQEESRSLMMNMSQILLLLVFYSSLSTGGMIFTVSLVLFLPVVDGGPIAAGEIALEELCACL